MIKRVLWGLGSLVIVAGGLVVYVMTHMTAQPLNPEVNRLGNYVQQAHIWNKSDYIKNEAIAPGKPVSDKDFAWLIGQLSGTLPTKGDRAAIVSLVEEKLTTARLTDRQQAVLKDATLPLLKTEDPTDNIGLIEENACQILEKYPDPRAIPQLHVLTASPHPWVRHHSALALNAVGEHVPVPPRPTTW